jgi:hypothetical protein
MGRRSDEEVDRLEVKLLEAYRQAHEAWLKQVVDEVDEKKAIWETQ